MPLTMQTQKAPSLLARTNTGFAPGTGCFSIQDLRVLYSEQPPDFRSKSLPKWGLTPRRPPAPADSADSSSDGEEDCTPELFQRSYTVKIRREPPCPAACKSDNRTTPADADSTLRDFNLPMHFWQTGGAPGGDAAAALTALEAPAASEATCPPHPRQAREFRHTGSGVPANLRASSAQSNLHRRLKVSLSAADAAASSVQAADPGPRHNATLGSAAGEGSAHPSILGLPKAGLGSGQPVESSWPGLLTTLTPGRGSKEGVLGADLSSSSGGEEAEGSLGSASLAGCGLGPSWSSSDLTTGRRSYDGTARRGGLPASTGVCTGVEIFCYSVSHTYGVPAASQRGAATFPTSSSLPVASGSVLVPRLRDVRPPVSPVQKLTTPMHSTPPSGSPLRSKDSRPPLRRGGPQGKRTLVKSHSEMEKRAPGQPTKPASRVLSRAQSEVERGFAKPKSILVVKEKGLERTSSLGRRVKFSQQIDLFTYSAGK